MIVMEAEFKIITPLFLGGAEPNIRAELRVPSIKGGLRYWYRAVDPEYRINEARLFGDGGDRGGQSSFILNVNPYISESNEWSDSKSPQLKYFSFPFNLKQSKRYIDRGKSFTLNFLFKKEPNDLDKKRIIASLWLLGHVGGLGARVRRGFGSVALSSISCKKGGAWECITQLALPNSSSTHEEWLKAFKRDLEVISAWFPGKRTVDHTVLSSKCRFLLFNDSGKSWRDALSKAAVLMSDFRNRRGVKDQEADYHKVKKHICAIQKNVAKKYPQISAKKLGTNETVERAAFGLPLTFRYNSLGGASTTFSGTTLGSPNKNYDRSASRLWIRIVKINKKYYPFFIMLDSPFLPESARLTDGKGDYSLPSDDILESFWAVSVKDNGVEVGW